MIEAFAAKLPVIATAVGGVPEIVRQDQTGWLVPAEQPDALAQAMTRLAAAPETASQLAQAGRDFYLQHLTDTAMVEQTVAVYQRCLALARHA